MNGNKGSNTGPLNLCTAKSTPPITNIIYLGGFNSMGLKLFISKILFCMLKVDEINGVENSRRNLAILNIVKRVTGAVEIRTLATKEGRVVSELSV